MKKSLLALAVLFYSLIVSAATGDTLTRAQVYNFTAGDTFEYEYFYGSSNGCPIPSGHYRTIVIITSTYHSQGGDTLFIGRKTISPTGVTSDTISFNNLSEYEIFIDSFSLITIFSVTTNSIYNGRILNSIDKAMFGGGDYHIFVQDLGNVYYHYRGEGFEGCEVEGSTNLIYYSKQSEHWGNFEDTLTGISSLTSSPAFSIFPNPASNSVTITIDETMLGSNLTISDITGRELMHSAVQIRNQQFEIRNFANGLYFVTIENEKGRTTKKLVIQK